MHGTHHHLLLMATRILTIAEWKEYESIPWEKWNRAIKEWNGIKHHRVKIPVPSGVSTAFMEPGEQRRAGKRFKKELKRPIIYQERLAWDEVCTKLPYVFGKQDKRLDPSKVYVCEKFLELVEKAR